MTIVRQENNTLKMYQGDTGRIKFTGFKTDKNYLISFSIYNSKREFITELKQNTEKSDSLIFKITQEISNKLTVAPNLIYETYYYGLKYNDAETGSENTIIMKNSKFGELNKLIVFPIKTEGL